MDRKRCCLAADPQKAEGSIEGRVVLAVKGEPVAGLHIFVMSVPVHSQTNIRDTDVRSICRNSAEGVATDEQTAPCARAERWDGCFPSLG